jgi:hypothetical protein
LEYIGTAPNDCGCDPDNICEPVRYEDNFNCGACATHGDRICDFGETTTFPADCSCNGNNVCEQLATETATNCNDCGCDNG